MSLGRATGLVFELDPDCRSELRLEPTGLCLARWKLLGPIGVRKEKPANGVRQYRLTVWPLLFGGIDAYTCKE
ncbi:unnamed protein product [Camellia sinensis]